MRDAVVGEVNKMIKTESNMYVIGYLESVLTAALEKLPKEQAERMMQIYFYDRPLPAKVSDDTREWLNKYGN